MTYTRVDGAWWCDLHRMVHLDGLVGWSEDHRPHLHPLFFEDNSPAVTASGRVLSDSDFEALADEAERGT